MKCFEQRTLHEAVNPSKRSLEDSLNMIRNFINAVLNQTKIAGIAVGITTENSTLLAEGFG